MGIRMDDLHTPTVSSGPTSSGTAESNDRNVSLSELAAKKENLEAELSALGSVLNSHGVNMSTPLLTPDGFPRADIDVAQIRTTRARIIRLKTDYKEIMAKLEVAVQEHFAAGKATDAVTARAPRVAASTNGGDAIAAATRDSTIEPPFATVNTVVANSPADEAGLKPGDKVTRFGTVNWTNHDRLSKVAQVVQQNENGSILVKVLRQASATTAPSALNLQLTPRRNWGGRGLLGCHLLPV